MTKKDISVLISVLGEIIGWLSKEKKYYLDETLIINDVKDWIDSEEYANDDVEATLKKLEAYLRDLRKGKSLESSVREEEQLEKIKSLEIEIKLLETKVDMYERFMQHKEKKVPDFPPMPDLDFKN
ncbi:hypothetical protein FUA23_16475 [Neolewinella aurantiaca]|uniref:Uncharacterized protein n=1 Tax=Neolewinella aurantiaca TaxID=2602767 RepID=A0A5C7FL61_9BACT|nr:hypothetical protein [Neolewinella aurantiaca]TXF88075.1 hypothetical protein FUA23_16475 [Neolewinella aurantiaca]